MKTYYDDDLDVEDEEIWRKEELDHKDSGNGDECETKTLSTEFNANSGDELQKEDINKESESNLRTLSTEFTN